MKLPKASKFWKWKFKTVIKTCYFFNFSLLTFMSNPYHYHFGTYVFLKELQNCILYIILARTLVVGDLRSEIKGY